jgi:hypothetical protein
VLVIRAAVFPQGMGYRAGSIPPALRPLPCLGVVSVAATAALVALEARASTAGWRRWELARHRVTAVCATLFIAWLAYWKLVGSPW